MTVFIMFTLMLSLRTKIGAAQGQCRLIAKRSFALTVNRYGFVLTPSPAYMANSALGTET